MLCQTRVHVRVGTTWAKRATDWWDSKPIVTGLVTADCSPAVDTVIRVISGWVLARQFPVGLRWGVASQSAIHSYARLHGSLVLVLVLVSTAEASSAVGVTSSSVHDSVCCSDVTSWSRARVWSIILRCILIIFDSLLSICCWWDLIVTSWSVCWSTATRACWSLSWGAGRSSWLVSTTIASRSTCRSCGLSYVSHSFLKRWYSCGGLSSHHLYRAVSKWVEHVLGHSFTWFGHRRWEYCALRITTFLLSDSWRSAWAGLTS